MSIAPPLLAALALTARGGGDGGDELLARAAAALRQGETDNCLARHAERACLYPLEGEALHTRPEGSRRAAALLEELLAREPERLDARWLLNLARMTLGEWPEGLPGHLVIRPRLQARGAAFPRFPNRAAALGLRGAHLAGGVVVEDFDGDGRLDIARSTMEPGGATLLYRGAAGGGLVESSAAAGLAGLPSGLNLVPCDFDGDGNRDLLVLRGAWRGREGRLAPLLLHNRGDGRFEDRAASAGLAVPAFPSQAAAFADLDRDGDEDLFLAAEAGPGMRWASRLLRNEGDGSFRDVTVESGILSIAHTKGVCAGDLDGDLYPDIVCSNMDGPVALYRNRGGLRFEEASAAAGLGRPVSGFPCALLDADGDGALDLFLGGYGDDLGEIVAAELDRPSAAEPSRLYLSDGRGRFRDVTAAWGLDRPTAVMALGVGDLDHDGFTDLYLGTGFPALEGLLPNRMFRNAAGRGFEEVTLSGGFGHLQKGHGIAFADLDGDGDQDVVAAFGGALAVDRASDAVFVNPGGGGGFLALELVGTRSVRSALGARARIDVEEGGRSRSIWLHVGAGGSFGAGPRSRLVGLGGARRVERVAVFWPALPDGAAAEVFHGLEPGRRYRLVEASTNLR